jgi:hypothetical protein
MKTGGVGPNATDMKQICDSTEIFAIGLTGFMAFLTTSDKITIELCKIM